MKKILALFLAAALAAGALTACSSGEEGSASGSSSSAAESSAPYEFTLDGAYQAVVNAYGEDFLPSMDITEEQLQDVMGIDTQYFEEFKAQGPMISTQVDTLIAVKAQPDHADDVEEELNKYRDSLLEGMNYPMNMPKIQASEVAVYDDYVFFVMLGKYNDTETDEAALLDFYIEQNDRGLEALHAYFNYQDPVLPEESESSAEAGAEDSENATEEEPSEGSSEEASAE